MRVAEIATGPVVGYRLWRILPFQDLEGPPSVRLCSAGTMGVPKFWPPREPVVAVCSGFKTTHAAPWPGHECGVWALDSLEAAEARVAGFVDTDNFIGSYGWAVGEVSLWGRVIEHEKGYRAQYAYPGALTVTTRREHAARALADVYGVPVEWRRRARVRPPIDEEEERPTRETLAEVRRRIANIESLLEPPVAKPDWRQATKERDDRELAEFKKLPPIALRGITPDELLVAFIGVYATNNHEAIYDRFTRDLVNGICPSNVCDLVLWQRGERGHFWASRGIEHVKRPGYQAAVRATLQAVESLASAGLAAGGKIRGATSRTWFLTPEGHERARLLCRGVSVTARVHYGGDSGFEEIPLDPVLDAIETSTPVRRELFDHERDHLLPILMEDRQRAQKRGPAAYARWLARTRKRLPAHMLQFSDAEVLEAIDVLSAGGPVELAAVRTYLLPGSKDARLRSETSMLSSQLHRLFKEGLARRIKQASGPNLWLPAAGAREKVTA